MIADGESVEAAEPRVEERPLVRPRHQRPRLGGDGRLLLPVAAIVEPDGAVRIPEFRRTVDPFDDFEDLLLAESLARLDLTDPYGLQAWCLEHGALDRAAFWGDPRSATVERPTRPVRDSAMELADEQAKVRWLLNVLVALSDGRLEREWVGAPYEEPLPVRHAWNGVPEATIGRAPELASSWDGMVSLVGQLIEPYVARAAERTFGLEFREQETRHGGRTVLMPYEWRVWRSILAPISLQLLESLRRITEGDPGAARCQECHEPFLILDGRRRRFCNERHRHRFNQRLRRRRLTQERAPDPERRRAADATR